MLSLYSIPNLITGILLLSVGLFVLMKNSKRLINRVFAALCFTSMVWQIFYFLAYNMKSENAAYLMFKFGYVGVIFIAGFFTHYPFILTGFDKKYKAYIRTMYALCIIFCLLIPTTPWFVKGVYSYFWGFYPKRGFIHPLFLVWFIGSVNVIVSLMCYVLFFKKKQLTALQVRQIILILVAFSVYSIACVDFIPNYGIQFYPFGYIPTFLFISIMGFGIIRYKLMEIDTVIHQTILWVLTLLLIILPVGLAVTFSMDWIASLSRIAKLGLSSVILIFFVWYYSKLKPYVDHIFRRRKYDYYQVLGEIGQKIGSELDINNVVGRLFKELKDVIYIRNGIVLVQEPGQLDYTEAGSMGYDQLVGVEKKKSVKLASGSSLVRWLQSTQKAMEREQIEADPAYESIKQEALNFLNENAIEVLIPVIMEDQVNALVGTGKKENLRAYTMKDVELLENMGKQIGITIDNAMHHEDIVEKERLAEEMKLGREIQMNLLPRQTPNISGLAVRGIMQPAKEIGGDYYDFITVSQRDALSIVIGDVSGKGVAAGLLMAMAKTAIHTLSQEEASPRQILLRTNNILNQHIGGQKFMTMLYLRWDASNRSLIYSSAGHEHILIYRSSTNKVETVQSGGFMLGMIPDISEFLEDKSIILNSKDKIVLYTDGVTEARNTGEDFFGLSKLVDTISRNGAKPANDLLVAIKDDVYSFIGTREQYDDITLVVMEAT